MTAIADAVQLMGRTQEARMARTPTRSEWQAAYLAALMEVNDASLAVRIENAEEAISRRLQSDSKLDLEESQALFDAIHGLHVLRTERLRDGSKNGRIS